MDAEHIDSISNAQASRIFGEAKNAVIANEDTMKSIILSEFFTLGINQHMKAFCY